MARMGESKYSSGTCACLEQAFRRIRKGYKGPTKIKCSSNRCPVKEVDGSVIDDFLKLIMALPLDTLDTAAALKTKPRLSPTESGL